MNDEIYKHLAVKQVERQLAENEEIRGHLGMLDENRLVFIGKRDCDKGTWYVAFRNEEGKDTKLRLSREAVAMLVQLYNKPHKGDDVFPIQIKTAWQLVSKDKESSHD